MESVNTRFKSLRIACNKSQEEFGKILGLSKSGISEIENGRRNVTDQHLIMLDNWKEKSINIDWIKTGTGEMFNEPDREQEIASMTAMLFKEEETSFKYRLINALCKLDEKGWEVLEQLAKEITNKKD